MINYAKIEVRKEQVAGHYISSNDKQTVSI